MMLGWAKLARTWGSGEGPKSGKGNRRGGRWQARPRPGTHLDLVYHLGLVLRRLVLDEHALEHEAAPITLPLHENDRALCVRKGGQSQRSVSRSEIRRG